eukprot:642753-Prorocentrum_lima.AAC.1
MSNNQAQRIIYWVLQESQASLAQLAEHAFRKRMVVGSIPTGGSMTCNASSSKNHLLADGLTATALTHE